VEKISIRKNGQSICEEGRMKDFLDLERRSHSAPVHVKNSDLAVKRQPWALHLYRVKEARNRKSFRNFAKGKVK